MDDALVSIHDVMPETLGDVAAILMGLEARGLVPVTLLVVPGRSWTPSAVEQLRRWQQAGHELAGHGWTHDTDRPRTIGHRLHAAFISRHCGEHLSLTAGEILALLRRSHRWFDQHGLGAPELYVPPAWALGPIGRAALCEQPFGQVELLTGVHDVVAGRFRRLPLLGFEADTRTRAAALRLWNRSTGRGVCPRLAIHPADRRLRLRRDLEQTLDRVTSTRTYGELRHRT